jgi:hypothetical protein
MNEARACGEKFPFSKYHVHAGRMRKDIWQYMKEHGASAPGDCLMRFAPVPAAISEVKSYPVAAVVHTDMMFADAADGWALIGKSGDVVPLWYGVEMARHPQVARFEAKHQGATLWGDSINWPKTSLLDDGAKQFGFAFEIKTCNACASPAHANVGYDFDRNGKFIGTHLLTIVPARRNMSDYFFLCPLIRNKNGRAFSLDFIRRATRARCPSPPSGGIICGDEV